jgi:hypothetical protein
MVAIPAKYRAEILNLLDSTRHTHWRWFKVSEAQKLTGKLAHLAKGDDWVFHLLSHLYSSIAYVLSENKWLLAKSSQEFCDMIHAIKSRKSFTPCKDLAQLTSFAMKRAAKRLTMLPTSTKLTLPCRQRLNYFKTS